MRFVRGVALVTTALLCASTAYAATTPTVSGKAAVTPTSRSNGEKHLIISSFEVSPEGVLALELWQEDDGPQSLQVARLADSAAQTLVEIPNASNPAWSPDGRTLAFSQEGQTTLLLNITNEQLGLYSLQTGKISMFLSKFVDRSPEWDPKGDRLAFARLDFPKDKVRGKVMVVGVSGGAFGKVTATSSDFMGVIGPTWSPSGQLVAFVDHRISFNADTAVIRGDMYLLDAASGKTTRLTNNGQVMKFSWSWSPDGRHLAFAEGHHFRSLDVMDVATRRSRTILRAKDLGQRYSIPEHHAVPFHSVSGVRWSPDGKHIVFQASQYDPGFGASYIGLIDWPSPKWRWLTSSGKSTNPRWLSDGEVAYVRDGKSIWRVHPDGSGAARLYVSE